MAEISKRPTIPCPTCKGEARVPISDELMEVLLFIRRRTGADAQTVFDKLGAKISISGINNRLEYLREIGLLRRERRGRRWFYSAL